MAEDDPTADPDLAKVQQSLDRVKRLLANAGLKFIDAPYPGFPGWLGIIVGFTKTDYVLLSTGMGVESSILLSSGVLRDINDDRESALDAVNRWNRGASWFTAAFAEARDFTSILLTRQESIRVLEESHAMLPELVRMLAQRSVPNLREQLTSDGVLVGQPWDWDDDDHRELLLKTWL